MIVAVSTSWYYVLVESKLSDDYGFTCKPPFTSPPLPPSPLFTLRAESTIDYHWKGVTTETKDHAHTWSWDDSAEFKSTAPKDTYLAANALTVIALIFGVVVLFGILLGLWIKATAASIDRVLYHKTKWFFSLFPILTCDVCVLCC